MNGALSTIKKHKPAIYTEIYDGHTDPSCSDTVVSFLSNLGYEGYFCRDSSWISLKEYDFSEQLSLPPSQCVVNFLFIATHAQKQNMKKFIEISEEAQKQKKELAVRDGKLIFFDNFS